MTGQTEIYVARHEHGFVKIGKSDDPVSRISSLQTACPYQIRLFTTITVDGDWSVVEAALHNAFDDCRVSAENTPRPLDYLMGPNLYYSRSHR